MYDIVHVRYFMTLVQKENLETLTRNLVELLSIVLLPVPFPHLIFQYPLELALTRLFRSIRAGRTHSMVRERHDHGPPFPSRRPSLQPLHRQARRSDERTGSKNRYRVILPSPLSSSALYYSLLRNRSTNRSRWVPHLSSHLKSPPYNLSVIADDRVSVTDPWRMCFNLGHLIGYEDVTAAHRSQVVGFGGGEDGERGKRMQEMLDGLNEELIGKGTTVDQEFVVVVAQKPLG